MQSYIDFNQNARTTLLITKKDKIGALVELLELFASRQLSLTHVESRTSLRVGFCGASQRGNLFF